jgi:hypothetical protein
MDERPKKPHYLPAQAYLALNRAVGVVDRGLDTLGIFLVGSCLERVDFRDVDVRAIMADEAYDKLFPGGESGTDSDAFWSLLCTAIGGYLAQATGLPIDFQIQRMTEANLLHRGLRNAISSVGCRYYPGELPSFARARGAQLDVPLSQEARAAYAVREGVVLIGPNGERVEVRCVDRDGTITCALADPATPV